MALRAFIAAGERVAISSLVLFEWRRGPRLPEELHAPEVLFPADEAVVFGPADAAVAAEIYRTIPRPRGREIDLAIAACAITHHARLWTLNARDFLDVPRLSLVD
jgi:predicted nucleic acid-binding protein